MLLLFPDQAMRIARLLFFGWIGQIVLLGGLAIAQDATDAATPGNETGYGLVSVGIRNAMQDRDYPKTIQLIDAELRQANSDQEQLMYLKGRALHFSKEYEAAIDVFEEQIKRFPESTWTRKGKFAIGQAYVQQGDYRKAEIAYREQATYLLSLDRKEEVASIYLDLATKAYEQGSEKSDNNLIQKALAFYGKAAEVGPKAGTVDQINLQVARCHHKLEHPGNAIQVYREKLIDQATSPSIRMQASYELGDVLLETGQLEEAREIWEDLLAKFQQDFPLKANTAYRLAQTYRFPKPADNQDLELGAASLRAYLEKYPEHENVPEAFFSLAEAYSHRGQGDNAVKALEQFLKIEQYSNTDSYAEARFLLGSIYSRQRKFEEAIGAYNAYLQNHPTHSKWSQAQQSIIDTHFNKANQAFTEKQYAAARELWLEFLVKYPIDHRAAQIQFQIGQSYFLEEKWQQAIDAWQRMADKYAGSNDAAQARYRIALVTEQKLEKLPEALEMYKQLSSTPVASQANARIGILTREQLKVATLRKFRSNQTPSVEVKSRNLKSVSVQVYPIDLETYFRKMQTTGGVENLDIALIDPALSFNYEIPKYEQYRLDTNSIEIPLADLQKENEMLRSGVAAVTVTGDKLEATTIVLQSDMEMIVKSSRDEIFVFAQNMKTGKPWSGARVLLSNGSQVFAEDKTGEDGVLRASKRDVGSCSDLRVLAVDQGHTAASVVNLEGLNVAVGLDRRGYIYTDRPVYRPGQLVHIRSIVRDVQQDQYFIPKDVEFELEIIDAKGRMLSHKRTKLNAFGSTGTFIVLPKQADVGTYQIVLRDTQVPTKQYRGHFEVKQFQLPRVRLDVKTEERVYYRGDKVKGSITAQYYHGDPVVNRNLTYVIDGKQIQAQTNEDGQVEFEISTQKFRNMRTISIQANMPSENAVGGTNVTISPVELKIQTALIRDVFLAGESFAVSGQLKDLEGEPVAKDVTLSVLKLPKSDAGPSQEVTVSEFELRTDDDGKVSKSIKLDDGGRYVLRYSTVDRFNHKITSSKTIQISDENDKKRLHILADRHQLNSGEKTNIKVHWRGQPTLALLTFEGSKVLEYRLLDLANGLNSIPVDVKTYLAPNFQMSICAMTDGQAKDLESEPVRFHIADSQFQVKRDLNIKLQIPEDATPGETIQAQLKATDALGNPVAAEISLAMVEKSLLDQFPSDLPEIRSFWQGNPRVFAMRSATSINFKYEPATEAISGALLAEEHRLLEEREDLAEIRGWQMDAVELNSRMEADKVEGRMPQGVPQRTLQRKQFSQQRAYSALPQLAAAQPANRPVSGRFSGGTHWHDPNQSGKQDFDADNWLYFDLGENGTEFALPATNEYSFGLQVLDNRGRFYNHTIELSDRVVSNQEIVGEFIELARGRGDILFPGLPMQETAFWAPDLTTNEEGVVQVDVALPSNSTTWEFVARGVTQDTLAGETEAEIVVSKELFGNLKLPMALQEGDAMQVPVQVFKKSAGAGDVQVSLEVKIGEKTVKQNRTLSFDGAGEASLLIPIDLKVDSVDSVDAKFELLVSHGEQKDVVRRSVPVRKRTFQVVRTQSGQASSGVTAAVDYPQGMKFTSPRLQVVLGPSIQADLINVLKPTAVPVYRRCVVLTTPLDSLTSDILAGVALERMLELTPDQGGPALETVQGKVDSAIASLSVMQKEDGGFSWSGSESTANRYSTARAVWALAISRDAGHRVDVDLFARSIQFLKNEIPRLTPTDFDGRATILHALTMAGERDFSLANQLHRNRNSLSAAACCYLALTFAEMDRNDTAVQVIDLVPAKLTQLGSLTGWNSSLVESQALHALALSKVKKQSKEFIAAAEKLWQSKSSHRWQPDKATGPAMLAIIVWRQQQQAPAETYTLTITVNGKPFTTKEIKADSPTNVFQIPADLLKGEKREVVRFAIEGRGHFTYRCELSADVPLDKLASTTKRWNVRRHYYPTPLRLDGEVIPSGFNVVSGGYSSFRNNLTQLPASERGRVELSVWRGGYKPNEEDQQFEYLVVTEPIPAGAVVDPSSIRGSFERYEQHPGYLLFYIGGNRSLGTIYYELTGMQPGEYYVGTPIVQDVYQPEKIEVTSSSTLKILPEGEPTGDVYRLTPTELYELGIRHYRKGRYEESEAHLTDLFSNWNLRNDPLRETVSALFDIHLQADNSANAVKFFELLIEKFPEENIEFAKLLKVGDAYNKLGEYERSYLVFRATVEANFMIESQVAGYLTDNGHIVRSMTVMEDLLHDTPQESYASIAQYALATDIYANAKTAAASEVAKRQKHGHVYFMQKSLQMLEQFLTMHPEDPSASEAAFALASGLTELDQFQKTIQACERYERRYPESKFLSSYWYLSAFCHFAIGEHQQALEMSKRVADSADQAPPSTRKFADQNRWRAIYIMGQIHHSLSEAAKAIEMYTKVKGRFVDAAQAIDYFTRQAVSLPEVTTFDPAEEVKLKLEYRNVKTCEVKVYRIDLMKFGLLQRNLQQITAINLAGIEPLHDVSIELGDGNDYADKTKDIPLPLDKEGAYLIVARADNLHASGLVLVSPLELEVNEDSTSGRVRVTVKTRREQKYLDDVHVKVIGTSNKEFTSGDTDLRGIFVADTIEGKSTVIAQAERGQYAFFRGETHLGQSSPNQQALPPSDSGYGSGGYAGNKESKRNSKDELLKGIQGGNGMIQEQQRQNLDRYYRNDARDGIKNFKF